MLGSAQPDPFGTERARRPGLDRRFGVGAHPHATSTVRELHQRREVACQGRQLQRHNAVDHVSGGAVDGNAVPFLQNDAGGMQSSGLDVDPKRTGAGDAGLADSPGNHGRVAGRAAANGQHPSDTCKP